MEMGPVLFKYLKREEFQQNQNQKFYKENQNHSIANVTIFIIIVIIPDNIGGWLCLTNTCVFTDFQDERHVNARRGGQVQEDDDEEDPEPVQHFYHSTMRKLAFNFIYLLYMYILTADE